MISDLGENVNENMNPKHQWDAKFGWYRYDSRFGFPVYGEDGDVERYKIFHMEMLIRHDTDGKWYLYDVVNIKKKRAPRLSNSCTVTNPFPS